MIDAWRLALGTLTAVPIRPPTRVTPRIAAGAMVAAPLAAVPVGCVAALVAWSATAAGLGVAVSAVLALGAVQLLTRGLHLDGLADTADGLASSVDRDRALDTMRRGDVGPVGVATLVFVVLAQAAAGAQLLDAAAAPAGNAMAFGLAVVASRAGITAGCARGVPSARSTGLGATVAGTVPRSAVVLSLLVLAGLAAGVTGMADAVPGWAGAAAVLAAAASAAVVYWWCVRRLAGITGDVLGAGVEIALAAALVTLAAMSR